MYRRSALFSVVLLNFLVALYPFQFGPTQEFANDAHYTADATLYTGLHNRAVTPGPPDWLAEAIDGEQLTIDLEARTNNPDQVGPARIVAVSDGPWDVDLAVAQLHGDLVVMVRRPGVDDKGEPLFVVPAVWGDLGWRHVVIRLDHAISVQVDGKNRLVEPLPSGTWATWRRDHRLAIGDEVYGDRDWTGEIRRAEFRTATVRVDYARPGNLDVPETFPYGFFRPWEPLTSPDSNEPWTALLHMAMFLPVGAALRRLRRPPIDHVLVVVVSAGLAVVVEVSKMLVVWRHPAVPDVLWLTVGALVGSLAYSLVMHERRNADVAGAGAAGDPR